MAKYKSITLTDLSQIPPTPSKGGMYQSALILDTKSFAWSWGAGTGGLLGNNATTPASSPVSVAGGLRWSQLVSIPYTPARVVGLDLNGYAWGWGDNSYGYLGTNTTTSSSSPVSALGGQQWKTISGNWFFTTALDMNSYAWHWGQTTPTSYVSSPVSVAGGRQFTQLVVSVEYSSQAALGLDVNSYAWCWGNNSYGGLGNNSVVSSSSPVSVVGNRQWLSVAAGGSGFGSYFIGLDTHSYAWSWGDNYYGYLGVNTTNYVSSPTSVVGGRQFSKIFTGPFGTYATFGLDTNGYVWSWGYNTNGQLGNNSISFQSSPVSVVGGLRFTSMLPGGQRDIFALGSNSTLWGWGDQTSGGLANGTTAYLSSPVSITSGFSNIWGTDTQTLYIVSGNKLWGWGNGSPLGDNVTDYRSSPVTINTTYIARGPATSIYGY